MVHQKLNVIQKTNQLAIFKMNINLTVCGCVFLSAFNSFKIDAKQSRNLLSHHKNFCCLIFMQIFPSFLSVPTRLLHP